MSDPFLGYAGIARETIFATAVAPVFYLPLRAVMINEAGQAAAITPHGLSGLVPRAPSFLPQVRVDFEPQPDALGLVLAALLGSPRTTLVSSGVCWQHVFEPRTMKQSVSLEAAIANLAFRAAGTQFDTLALSVRPGGRMQASLNGAARAASLVATSTASFRTEEAPTWQNVSYVVSAAQGGGQEFTLTGLQVTISYPTMAVGGHGVAGRISALRPGGPAAAKIGFSVLPPTSAWLSYKAGIIDIGGSVKATGSLLGTSSYQIVVDCPATRLTESPFDVGPRPVEMSGMKEAFASTNAVRSLKVTLVNATSGY